MHPIKALKIFERALVLEGSSVEYRRRRPSTSCSPSHDDSHNKGNSAGQTWDLLAGVDKSGWCSVAHRLGS
jgi:hypothetical protein